MSSTPCISHTINGFSRYEIPQSVAFSATAGILYPVRVDFMNARDVRYIQAGAVIRTNPALVPTFTPFRASLHRFFVPMQLYHPEMRVNSSKFSFSDLSTNYIFSPVLSHGIIDSSTAVVKSPFNDSFPGRSLMAFLGLCSGLRHRVSAGSDVGARAASYTSTTMEMGTTGVNADPLLAYYDIIRNYYAFSQVDAVSFAFPAAGDNYSTNLRMPCPNYLIVPKEVSYVGAVGTELPVGPTNAAWKQAIVSVAPLDDYFESAFYPKRGEAKGLYYNRLPGICNALSLSLSGKSLDVQNSSGRSEEDICKQWFYNAIREPNTTVSTGTTGSSIASYWCSRLPFGAAPAVADRLSRLLGTETVEDVSISAVTTVRGLAFASKLQAYRDLLTAGGSRFTDWLMTFFASKVSHVDKPVLVYSNSFYLNSSPIFSQQGGETLGTYAGVIEGQNAFGKKAQRYSFDEPGYLIDIFCIRPLYYWSGIQMDYARYDKMDYFNPLFNEIGYEDVPGTVFGLNLPLQGSSLVAKQPCYNEFRASFDRVLGDMAVLPGQVLNEDNLNRLWVQQRAPISTSAAEGVPVGSDYIRYTYFVDIDRTNDVFASRVEDNMFVNLYYNVSSKTLVSKNFATNLATR